VDKLCGKPAPLVDNVCGNPVPLVDKLGGNPLPLPYNIDNTRFPSQGISSFKWGKFWCNPVYNITTTK
jgi:hypothetical protein